MIKNNIDLAEKDNWLEKERLRESKISAWDFDEGKKIRNEHAQSCDVKEIADRHHQRHSIREKINYSATGGNERPRSNVPVWFFLDIALLFVLIVYSSVSWHPSALLYYAIAVVFLSINPGLIIAMLGFKRFPPQKYWMTVFIVAMILAVAAILSGGSKTYYY